MESHNTHQSAQNWSCGAFMDSKTQLQFPNTGSFFPKKENGVGKATKLGQKCQKIAWKKLLNMTKK